MVFLNGIPNGTRNTVQWYMNGTWFNGIQNGPMVFLTVYIRSPSTSLLMIFWMVFWIVYHSNTIEECAEERRRNTIQNTIHSSTIYLSLAIIHPGTIQISFNCTWIFIHRDHPKYQWSTIQIALAIIPGGEWWSRGRVPDCQSKGGSVPSTPFRFRTPHICLCLSEEILKAGGPFYMVSMPWEVKYPTQVGNV